MNQEKRPSLRAIERELRKKGYRGSHENLQTVAKLLQSGVTDFEELVASDLLNNVNAAVERNLVRFASGGSKFRVSGTIPGRGTGKAINKAADETAEKAIRIVNERYGGKYPIKPSSYSVIAHFNGSYRIIDLNKNRRTVYRGTWKGKIPLSIKVGNIRQDRIAEEMERRAKHLIEETIPDDVLRDLPDRWKSPDSGYRLELDAIKIRWEVVPQGDFDIDLDERKR